LEHLSSPDPVVKHALAANIRNACVNVGFFYGKSLSIIFIFQLRCDLVKNHGIPQDIIDGTLAASKKYFSLPVSEKIKVRLAVDFS
jgi:isopenicillin N synthase-like dioxygenase